MIRMEASASRCCELLSVAGLVRVSSCGCLWPPAARPPLRTCLVLNGVVPAVLAPAEAEALDSHGCKLLLPAIVHVDLYTCLWRAAAHSSQQVYPVWAGVVRAVGARAGWRRWTLADINCCVR